MVTATPPPVLPVNHRHEAFKIEHELQSDARVLRQIASALKDVTEYPPAGRCATPILVPVLTQ